MLASRTLIISLPSPSVVSRALKAVLTSAATSWLGSAFTKQFFSREKLKICSGERIVRPAYPIARLVLDDGISQPGIPRCEFEMRCSGSLVARLLSRGTLLYCTLLEISSVAHCASPTLECWRDVPHESTTTTHQSLMPRR